MTDSGETNQFKVYLGTWTNWSRGRVLGATLTLEPRYGLLLLSVTTTFVGFVASRSWRIVALILHRIYSTPDPRDALHHQRQVVLRNSMSAISTLWITLQLTWCWRAIANGYLARTLPIILFAILGVCAFAVAGAFISSISSGIGNEVLIDSSRCGLIVRGSLTNDSLSLIYPLASQSQKNAANYAQQCYSFNSTGTLECATFVKSRLRFTSDLTASCPFNDSSICRSNNSNLLLDSGLISSDDLGLNLPADQRMFYRQVLHCAPLRTDGFKKQVSRGYSNYTRYYYGRGKPDTSFDRDWSFEAENLRPKYMRRDSQQPYQGGTGFELFSISSNNVNGTFSLDYSDFIPIPQLIVPDAELKLVFLSPDGVVYLDQTNDPWYRGVLPLYNGADGDLGQRSLYLSDEAASPMGCTMRRQYCNFNKTCGSLAGNTDALSSVMTLFHMSSEEAYYGDGVQAGPLELDATRNRFQMFQAPILSSASFTDLLQGLGPSSLLSIEHMFQGIMGPLPDNQWQLDVIYWFEMLLASIQASLVDTARGPTDDRLMPYVATPGNKYQWQVCKNQKILSTDYTSLSLFGLYFTYITGLVIIVASYAAEPVLAFCYSRSKYKEYKYLEWTANSTLQLQRLAYQGLGSEKWTNYTDDIPRTRPGYFLADLTRAYPLEADGDGIQEFKPTAHAPSTATLSISGVSTDQSLPGQPHAAPAPSTATSSPAAPHPPQLAVPHIWKAFPPIPQPVSPSPQATTSSLHAVLPSPQAVSPVSQTVSPISQSDAV
ncbi:hypothetical protein KVR01_003790 [Diaporthe batatas]|uniref:uncharacterized protein n=1 Tax=Diaporthe batatas TaxID=748121 RepID=UPI001D055049|nr:uncharacterized protein KVR01_003790 [Diaporthe batatas]KAG8168101.1 hypothetical protein KVR01_003790 [Diaporthe batatas]